ncbi:hypothetical protein HOY82DRAFT_537813 [Tuber indicum]|nr:hypothetical protein HOY82DRAFT_537813 [Tuber indicum]
MRVKDTGSSGQPRVCDTTDIHPGFVIFASSTLPDVRQLRPRPYVVLFRKQKYIISLPFTTPRLCRSFSDARRYYEREPDTYYPIAPNENGGIYEPISVALGSFSGYIDLLCPTTLGKHTIEWGRNMGRISGEDLTKVIHAHKRLAWGIEDVPHKPRIAPPLADMSSAMPLSQSEPGSTQGVDNDRQNPRCRHLPIKARPHYRGSPDDGSDGKGGGGNQDSRGLTLGQREAYLQDSIVRHKRRWQDSGQKSLKRTRHLSPSPVDTIRGAECRTGRGYLDCYAKPEGASEEISTLSPTSAKSWVWSGTSSESEETSEATREGGIGQEGIAVPNMTSPWAPPFDGRAFPPFVTIDTASPGARTSLPNPDVDGRHEFSHRYSVQPYRRF